MPRRADGLSDKRKVFCQEYLVDLCGTKAAVRAGYSKHSAHTIAAENLSRQDVQEEIKRLMEERAARTEVTLDKVVKEIAAVAFSSIGDYLAYSNDGIDLAPSESLTDDQKRCISEVSFRDTKEGRTVNFKMHPKLEALEKLMKHLGGYEADKAPDTMTVRVVMDLGRDDDGNIV